MSLSSKNNYCNSFEENVMRALPVLAMSAYCLTFGVFQERLMAQNTPTSYPDTVVTGFIETCVQQGDQQVSAEIMKKICTCSISGIQNQYTYAEFIEIDKALNQGKELPPEVTQVVQDCVQQSL
jgi:hypothetical protein